MFLLFLGLFNVEDFCKWHGAASNIKKDLNMKVFLRISFSAFLGLFAAAKVAKANDTSWPTIEVDEINTDTKVGSYMSFSGEESRKLMEILPRQSSVLGEKVDNHLRSLDILSPGYMISIFCRDVADRTARIPTTPNCTIRFNHRVSESPIPFEPKQCTARD